MPETVRHIHMFYRNRNLVPCVILKMKLIVHDVKCSNVLNVQPMLTLILYLCSLLLSRAMQQCHMNVG